MPKSSLPFGRQFSPAQVDLPRLLELVVAHEGSRGALTEAVRKEFFGRIPARKTQGRQKDGGGLGQADNCFLSLRSYGIAASETDAPDTDRYVVTKLGRAMYEARADGKKLYELFAKDILLNRMGLVLIETVRDLRTGGHKITRQAIVDALAEGPQVATHGDIDHLSPMNHWLAEAGVFRDRGKWDINDERVEQLLGLSEREIEGLAGLTTEQRAFVKAFARLGGVTCPHSDVADYVETAMGLSLDRKQIPQRILQPLHDLGLVRAERVSGGKPYLVHKTDKLQVQVIEPILVDLERCIGSKLRSLIRMPLTQVVDDLDGADKNKRGRALEALAIHLMRLVGLRFVDWRRRAKDTGNNEVDAIFEGTHLLFSRWQVQCKAVKDAVGIDVVAREVGMQVQLKSNVIMMVTTGAYASPARDYARLVMEDTNLQIVLVEGRDVSQIRESPAQIVHILKREAVRAMEIKRLDI